LIVFFGAGGRGEDECDERGGAERRQDYCSAFTTSGVTSVPP
jgi:hypothetical protein